MVHGGELGRGEFKIDAQLFGGDFVHVSHRDDRLDGRAADFARNQGQRFAGDKREDEKHHQNGGERD